MRENEKENESYTQGLIHFHIYVISFQELSVENDWTDLVLRGESWWPVSTDIFSFCISNIYIAIVPFAVNLDWSLSEREGEGDLWVEPKKQRPLWHHDVPQEPSYQGLWESGLSAEGRGKNHVLFIIKLDKHSALLH